MPVGQTVGIEKVFKVKLPQRLLQSKPIAFALFFF